ncbi:MAG: hypothetical protein JXA99_12370 [Candidatus Lokiarchaeota archaeon]|nr:hypothetical protein [Candidatus Lokiarchaeota archaeon]
MKLIHSLTSLFSNEAIFDKITEDIEKIECKFETSELLIPEKDLVLQKIKQFPGRDDVILDITLDAGDPISYYSKSPQLLDNFLQDLNTIFDIKDDDSIFSIKITVNKNIEQKKLTVYNYKIFTDYLHNMSVNGLLYIFKKFINSSDVLFFEVFEEIVPYYTSSIYFGSYKDNATFEYLKYQRPNRKLILKKQADICHFTNASEYEFIPNDFYLIQRSQIDKNNLLFDKLLIIFSMIFLYDVTSIKNDDRFFYKLNGYKVISNEIDFISLKIDHASEYFDIFDWVYNEGNLSDKIGLARNIISLHSSDNNPFKLEGQPLSSIKSSYEIYLKQNVKQYIEVKNKLSEFLLESSQRANRIVESFAGSFKSSILVFISFFTSMILIKILSKGNLTDVFTEDVSYLSFAFLLISFIYFIVSLLELKKNKNRFSDSYNNLKNRYKDLLDPIDLNKIFQNDEELESDLSFIKKRMMNYSILWLSSLLIFFGTVFYFGILSKDSIRVNKEISINNKLQTQCDTLIHEDTTQSQKNKNINNK